MSSAVSRSDPTRLINNTLWNLVGRAAQLGVGLFLTPYLLTHLGQERFGLWALANLLIGYLSLADMGIQSSLVRHIAHSQPDERPLEFSRIISTSFFFYLGASVLSAPLSLWAGPALLRVFQLGGNETVPASLADEAQFVITFVMATLFLSLALAVFSSIPTGLQRMDRANQLVVLTSVGNLIAALVAIEGGWGVRGLVVGMILVKLLVAVVTYAVSLRLFDRMQVSTRHVHWSVWKELFEFGWKIQVARLCELLTFGFDRLLLSAVGGIAALGRYQPAVQVSTQVRMLPHFLVMAALPYASDLSGRADRRALNELYIRGTLYLTFASFAVLGFVAASAPLLTRLWLGPGYDDVALWIRIFSLAYLTTNPLSLGGLISQAIGRPGIQARSALLGTLCTVVFSTTGYWLAGITGLAVGSALAAVVAGAWFFQRLNRVMEIPHRTVVRRAFLAPAAYLLPPAALLALGVEWFPAQETGSALLALALASLSFSVPVLFGISRLDLWNVHAQLAPTAPSSGSPTREGNRSSQL